MDNLATVPIIIFAVYFIIWLLKKFVFKTNESRKNLPPIAGATGVAIALAFYFFAPQEIGFDSIVDAATQGAASGFAAVGCNQVYKQWKKFNGDTSVVVEEDVPTVEDMEAMNDAADDDRVGG